MATKTEVEMLEKVNDTESSKTAKDEESSTPPATNFEEEDPVVTPKTWLVVFVSNVVPRFWSFKKIDIIKAIVHGLWAILLVRSADGRSREPNLC